MRLIKRNYTTRVVRYAVKVLGLLIALLASSFNASLAAENIIYNDFYLPEEYAKYMPLLKSGAPQVMKEAGCDVIDYADVSSTKGSKANPVFYYTCVKNGIPTNIFVSKTDLEKGATTVAKPINEGTAKRQCEDFAKGELNHPSTFDSGIFDWGSQTWPNGRRRIVMDFTAKNSFNMELPASVNCLFIPDGKGGYDLEGNVIEQR